MESNEHPQLDAFVRAFSVRNWSDFYRTDAYIS